MVKFLEIGKSMGKYMEIYGHIQHKGKYRWKSLLIYYTDSRDFPIQKKNTKDSCFQQSPVGENRAGD